MHLAAVLARHFSFARNVPVPTNLSIGVLHRWRSRQWVESLATQFRSAGDYESDPQIRVLTQSNSAHKAEFGLNELLYDMLVCRIATTLSPTHKKPLVFVHDVLWQVESELERNTRAAFVDFNKLVLGAAQHKLFVGPLVHDVPTYLATLLPAARRCTNKVSVALIPHPQDWTTTHADVRLWHFHNDGWQLDDYATNE